jgi:hypothetical protein
VWPRGGRICSRVGQASSATRGHLDTGPARLRGLLIWCSGTLVPGLVGWGAGDPWSGRAAATSPSLAVPSSASGAQGRLTLELASVTFLVTGVIVLVTSRGRHLAWPVFLSIAVAAALPAWR